ncbi:MAG: RNA-binding protein [Mariprofundaceae bacterium]
MMCFLKLLVAAVLLSVVGYYVMPFLGMSGSPEASIFATGILVGVLLGGLLPLLLPKSSGAKSNPNVLYVGNVPFNAREDEVQRLFEAYGTVKAVRLVTGGPNKRPKGYGFVEMDAAGVEAALVLNGSEFGGRKLRVNSAKNKSE